MSVSVAPRVDPERWTWLPLLAGLAVLEGIERATGRAVPLDLKWPNDVLAGDRKLCGILAERIETPADPVVVIGMGINVALSADRAAGADRDLAGAAARRPATGPDPGDRRGAAPVGRAGGRLGGAASTRPRRTWPAARPSAATSGSSWPATATCTAGPPASTPRAALIVTTASGPVIVGAGDVVHVR